MYCDWLQNVTGHQAMMPWLRETPCYGSFTPNRNWNRLTSNLLQTDFQLASYFLNMIGCHWICTVPFTPILESKASREPV